MNKEQKLRKEEEEKNGAYILSSLFLHLSVYWY